MNTWSRRKVETVLLAALGVAAVVPFRFFAENRGWFLGEMLCISALFVCVLIVSCWPRPWRHATIASTCVIAALIATPIVFAILARAFGSPIPFEMSALAAFGAASVGLSLTDSSRRCWSLSLVVSGFLILFCAAISDNPNAVGLPLLWMLICVWHLVANRWERLDLAMPESVERSWTLRPRIIIIALLVLTVGGYLIKDKVPASQRFTFGIMPTSGGSGWSDPAARSGVGTGDQAIAAKDHAESFGAVESDIFLESKESTLFDMFSDSLGPPKKQKLVFEKRQGMGNENVIPMHHKAASTDKGAGSFSTERTTSNKHTQPNSSLSSTVIQWDGPTGIRLAMQRYDTFDGHTWSQSGNLSQDDLTRIDINKAPWFFDPDTRDSFLNATDSVSVGLLKVIRLDSTRLPVPMLTAGVHIKEVVRRDFFAIAEDGSFFMPGRKKVPPMTVVHVASSNLTEDEIRAQLDPKPTPNTSALEAMNLPAATTKLFDQLADSARAEHANATDQLFSCIQQLRTEFKFERDGETAANSLNEFMRSRHGGDHLFATAAALLAKELGLPARLVTGFYVRPDAFEITAGHACVLPEDVHVWAEVKLNDGRWFEIEATPGYRQPHYQPSWGLLTRQFAAAHWPLLLATILSLVTVYISRRLWIDALLSALWCFSVWLRPRHRIRLALKIIEARASLAGSARPMGKPQRAWLEDLVAPDQNLTIATKRFTDAADCLCFGHGQVLTHQDDLKLVSSLRVRTLMSLKPSSQE